MKGFNELILDWLREHHDSDAASIEKVDGYGTDWAGGTEEGFWSEFSVSISYVKNDGKKGFVDVTGELMGSLWKAVINAYPIGSGDD